MAALDSPPDERAGGSGAEDGLTGGRFAHDGLGVPPASLVGRVEELARLVSVVTAPPALALVEGEAGIGKTRLITELRRRPELAGQRVLVGAARAISEPFPLGPLLEAVRTVGGEVSPAALSPVTGALRPLLPELVGLLPDAPEPLHDRVAERHRVFRGLRDLLAQLCPVTVVLEDLHWADRQTVEFVQYVINGAPPGLSLVGTFRGEQVDPQVRGLTRRLPSGVGSVHLELAPLDVAQTGRLAAAMVAADRVSPEFASYLCARTGGLPFAVEEVMALLRERGDVAQVRGRWWRAVFDELAVPAVLRDHVLARAELVPPATRSLLDTVAVLHDPVPEQVIAAVSHRSPEQVAEELVPAIHARLLVDHHGAVGFRHLLAAQAIYDQIPGPHRRRLHEQAATVLREASPERLGGIAHHLRRAGRLAEWAITAEGAAERAAALGHDDEVVALLEDVLQHAPVTDEAAGRLAAKLSRAAIAMLHPPDVDHVLSAVLQRELAGPVRAELQLLRGALFDHLEADRPRRELFQEAARNAGHRTDVKAWALIAGVMRCPPETTYQEQRRSLSEALELLPTLQDRDFETFLLGKAGLILTLLGDPRWRELAAQIERQAQREPRRRPHVNAYESLGSAAVFVGHYATTERLLTAALRGAVAVEDPRLEAFVRTGLLLLDFCRGHWNGTPEAATLLADQLGGQARTRYRMDVVIGNVALARGDLERAEQVLTDVLTGILHNEDSDMLSMTVSPLVRLAVARGEPEAAAAIADRYLSAQAGFPLWPAAFRSLPSLVEALAAVGRVQEAQGMVSRFASELADRDMALAPTALRYARGFLAAAAGTPATAAEMFQAAAAGYESLQCPYEAAQAREHAVHALAAAGDMAAVEQPMRGVLAGFEQLGAAWDLARAARAARRYGVSVPARHRGGHRGYGNELSPREQEVVDLVVTGRTNQEIAAELFVTPETVKKHLQAVMRKWGVRSRSALAHHLLQQRPPDHDLR